jgi:acetoacetyl-CoA synthetase
VARAPKVLWQPDDERIARANVTRFARAHGLPTAYPELLRWSLDHLDDFWRLVWKHFDAGMAPAPATVLASRDMPGAQWFPGAELNYAERLLRGAADRADRIALHHASESRATGTWTWGELLEQVTRIQASLRELGVGRGDRVAAYLPNVPETLAAFLATAALGAIWTSAAPEFGARSVVDRSAQVAEIAAALPGEPAVVTLGLLAGTGWPDGFAGPVAPGTAPTFEPLPFDHPLYLLFSSGTTGLPKPIVHGHGGILLTHLKHMHLHVDAQAGDRIFWFTTTGWMMWNFLVSVLLTDAEIVLFDGNPAGDVLWDLAAETGITTFGTSAAWIAAQQKAGARPREGRDLRIRAVGSTGSPLSPEGFAWVYDELGSDTWLFSTSGGTDVCTAFVTGVPVLPVFEGELQCVALGCDVQAWDEQGRSVVDEVGELVVAQPMPSMPVGFWGDADGSRLREAYFEHFPGVWRHGDWIEITSRGTAIISGRSDSTINRGGVRMGTAEIYRAVLAEDDVVDALVVDVPRPGAENHMPLFVVLREGVTLDDDLRRRVARRVREDCSPRHVPDELVQIAEVPRTLSGKALEVPVKRILMGVDPDRAVSRESLANPAALEPFIARAAST